MYTKEQILNEIKAFKSGTLFDSDIVDEWMDMATEWLTTDPQTFAKDGFDGFEERSPEQILVDFYLNDKVADMSESEYNQIMDKLNGK